jgi:hypothetical protein
LPALNRGWTLLIVVGSPACCCRRNGTFSAHFTLDGIHRSGVNDALSSAGRVTQLADFAVIFKGQRFGQWDLQTRLQELNELHEDPVIRVGVSGSGLITGEDKTKMSTG